mgnify:CR=1 FL=1
MTVQEPRSVRNAAFLGTLIALTGLLIIQACTRREIVPVVVLSVTVAPSTANVLEGDTVGFDALIRDEDGDELSPTGGVVWSSDDPSIVTIDSNGTATGQLRGTTTIRATFQGIVGTAQVTVLQTAGIAVSQASGPTTEAGGQATFTVVLESQPTADVTIGLGSSDATEGTVLPASVTFTTADWNLAQTVTATGQDDAVADGNVGYTIATSPSTSVDSRYAGINAADVLVTNNDDDTPGATVSPVSGPTTEVGGLATFTIVLTSEPTADVTIGLSSNDTTEGTLSVPSVTFTSTNWSVPQTVIVTGRNDAFADGNIVYSIVTAPATSTDAQYAGLNAADISVTNIDDETAGITVSPATGPTTEIGGQATFTIVLNAAPTAAVTVNVASSDIGEGTLSTGTLSFNGANWNVAQTVTVTGQDDDVDDGDIGYSVITAAAISPDANYNGLNAVDVAVTNVDDETAGVTVSPPNGPTTEPGGTATFTVVLDSEPTADVTIALSSNDTSEGTVGTGSVTFTSANWAVPRPVIATGVNDLLADGNVAYAIVTAPVTSTDPTYNGIDPVDVSITNVDDETAGIAVSAASGPTTEIGGQATFTVVLNTQPTASVTIDLNSSDLTEGTVSPPSLTFTTGNWSVARIVTVSGQNDAIDDGDIVYSIVTAPATSTDTNYSGLNASDVTMTNVDDETAGVRVSPPSGPTTEVGGQATFSVVLDSEPTASVTVGVSSSDATEGLVTGPVGGTLTFTPSGPGIWSTPQTVTVTGQNDVVVDGNVVYTIVTAAATSTDAKYDGLNAADVSMTNVDDETAGITVSPANGPTTEAGGQSIFTVVLNNQPSASVIVGISSSDLTEGTVSVASLTFNPSGAGIWSTPQTVTVTGQSDAIDDDNVVYTIVTGAAVSTDANYNGINAADVSVTNVDDDTAGFTVTAASGPTTEAGGAATFTIRLNSEPAANVVIGLSSNDLTEGTVSPASLTFTPSGGTVWSTPRTVTVTGVNDALDDDNIVFLIETTAATSTDPKYSGLNAVDVSFTNVDDDAAGISVSPVDRPTTEAPGGTATFTVVLNTIPSANVTIPISSSDTSEGTVSTGLLTFLPADWNTPQTVTVTGQNDFHDDGDIAYSIVTGASSSADTRYNGINPADVAVTNTDNDQAGITVSPASGPTTEAGGTATFTVVLTSEPTAAVTIGVLSTDPSEGVVTNPAGGTLTFNPSGAGIWSTPQTVTVTGQNDLLDDDNVVYSIVTAQATSTDPLYAAINPVDVPMTNVDDETAGITVSPVSGPTTEMGGTATFTIVLNTAPTAAVTIGVSSSDATEGVVTNPAGGTLTFNPSGGGIWSTPQTVTVTGQNDPEVDGNIVYTIMTAPAASSDASYNNLNAVDVSITNIDDETAGITVSAISGPTTETAGTATFTVVLNSMPSANVSIVVSSNDATEGLVTSPSPVVFTTGNWSSAQTVTVTGQNDNFDDGNIAYLIVTAAAVSTDPNYTGRNAADVAVTNVDDETAGVTVSAVTGPTTENGDIAQFTVVLNSEPTAVVSIALVSTDTSEGVITSSTPIEFNGTNWNVPQTVTVEGQDDDIDDDNVAYAIVTTATSADPLYDNIAIADPPITNVDDGDLVGIVVTPTSGLVTTEGGGTAQFTVVLNSEPTANVSIVVSSSDGTEGLVTSTTPLVFTAGNWDTPQAVTVTGQNDFIDDASVTYTILTSQATSVDAKYAGIDPANVSVSNSDDADTAGVTVTPTGGLTTSESGTTAQFTVALTSEPVANVTISIATSDSGEGQVSPPSLTFTAAPGANAWDTPHTVTITGQNDNLDDGDQPYTILTGATVSADPLYSGMAVPDVSVSSTDIHAAALSINDVAVTEGNTPGTVNADFTVSLSVPSTQTVTVQYATANGTATAPGDYTAIALTTLTFTPGVTTQPVTVVVQGDQLDELDETFNVTLSGATNATITDATGVGTITDDDTNGFIVTQSDGTTIVAEAVGADVIEVVLAARPLSDVVIDVVVGDASEVSASPLQLTFTDANWNIAQPVDIFGESDEVNDGDQVTTVTISINAASDDAWDALSDQTVSVTTVDDDIAGFTIIQTAGTTSVTEGGNGDLFDVFLNAEPLTNVEIIITSADPNDVRVEDLASIVLTFTPLNWNGPQQVDITPFDDLVAEGPHTTDITISVNDSASDDAFDLVPDQTVQVTVVDDD